MFRAVATRRAHGPYVRSLRMPLWDISIFWLMFLAGAQQRMPA